MTPKKRVLKAFPKAHAYTMPTTGRHYVTQTRASGIVLAFSDKSRRDAWRWAAEFAADKKVIN